MFRELDGARIVDTLDLLRRRIAERFPAAGLNQIARELREVAAQSLERTASLGRPTGRSASPSSR